MESDSGVTRRRLIGAGVGGGVLALAGCAEPSPPEDPGGELDVYHPDVGQADATVFRTPEDETVVVDTGNWWQDGEDVIDLLEGLGIEHIEHLIATHAHADHIGGHADVIEHFETERDGIGFIYDSGVSHSTQTYDDYIEAVENHGHELLVVEEGEALPIGGVSVTALNPPSGESGDDLHYNCVTLRVDHDGVSYLTTGDAEEDAESRMVGAWGTDLLADVYEVGHHGAVQSTTDSFLSTVDPDMAVISSAYDSQFGHPHDEVLLAFDEFGVETYWTGVHAETTLTVADGGVWTDTEEIHSTDPMELLDAKPDVETDSLVPIAVDGSGTTTLVVDRIESGVAVLLAESAGEVTGQSVVPPERLPDGADEGTVLSVTVENGAIRDIAVDAAATEQRRASAEDRLERLATPLSQLQ